MVHQHYLMPGEPGGSRFNEMARFWSEAGHDVTVVAGALNYSTGVTPARYRRSWVVRERDGDVAVLRCFVPSTYSRSYAGRMWAFAGFLLSATTAALRVPRPDVVIATSPPLLTVIPAWVAARMRRRKAPWIFEIRDLWPESAVTTGVLRRNGRLTRALFRLERWACGAATRINVLTPAFGDDLVRRGLAPPERIVFVPNGADTRLFRPGPRDNDVRRALGWGDRTVVLYSGAHGRANALGQLLDAAELLGDRPDILVATVGDGPERETLEREARRRKLANMAFYGPQPKDRMPQFVNACDIGAAVLAANPTFRTVYPNKVFDYMACERPVLLAVDGAARDLVCQQARAGVFADPENPVALADRIRGLADDPDGRADMGRRGRAWVLAHATREALAVEYLEVMRRLGAS